ncbi:hypothetical protein [Chryseobacterium sp.]|uniref:hypothetical protein n=1 Tax=Chryseobacterium sp. TaxID=1871047 RepID=UPI002FC9279E
MKAFLLLFLFGSLTAQSVREKGKVFKLRPTYPYENLDNSGLIVVKRTMYGLYFEDNKLSDDTKKRIEKFFRQQNKGYTDFKTYHLKIRRKNNDWFIDNHKF